MAERKPFLLRIDPALWAEVYNGTNGTCILPVTAPACFYRAKNLNNLP